MDSRKIVYQETAIIAIGEFICTALMLVIFSLLGYWSTSVLWGGLIGSVLAIGNFFFMAVFASLAADKAQQQDVDGGKKLMKGSYPLRLLVLAVLLVACIKSGLCHPLALLIPLVFVRPVLTIAEFFRKKGV